MSLSASDVSVVTVNWNGRDHLSHLLPTLSRLGCGEIIVVDNGSEDGSQEFLLKSYPQVRLIQNPTNEGFAHPCNRGAEEASRPIVAFINNDMAAEPEWLQAALPLIDEATPCVASRILDWEGRHVDFNGGSLQYLGFALQKDIGRLADEVTHDDRVLFPCGGATLVDRGVYLKSGGFDPDYFAIFEDVDFGWRMWVLGYEVAFAPESIVRHRGHSTFNRHGDHKLRYLMHRNALMTIVKNYEDDVIRRVFPAAVRLTIKRALLLSGVEKESFYLWSRAGSELNSGDQRVQDRWIDALNQIVALDDVYEAMPRLLEKRRVIQSSRRRSDRQILHLFQDPLRRIVEDPEYQHEESEWLGRLGLEDLFASPEFLERGRLESDLDEKIRRMRRELSAGRWLASSVWQNPPPPRRPGLRAVLNSLRHDGLGMTVRRIAGRLKP